MEDAAKILGLVNLVAFGALAVVAVRQWYLRRDEAAAWAALGLGALGAVVLVDRLVPDDPNALLEHVAQRATILALLAFPYLLFRFTTAFDPASRTLARGLALVTAALGVWTVLLPQIPSEGEPRSTGFTVYVIAFVAHWAILSVVAAWRLWRAGLGQPGVARRRMHMLSLAAAAITAALLMVAFGGGAGPRTASAALATISAVAFMLGLAPPASLRILWRRGEQDQLQRAVSSLMEVAGSEQEVAERVLAPTAAIVGARGVEIRNDRGKVVASHGNLGELVDAQVLPTSGGTLTVWTSRYAPFFGDEELRLLATLGSLIGLGLDRARLFAQERDARLALEQADRLKSEFVALAAHELRTPVATVAGIVQTFARLPPGDERRGELERMLVQQTQRLGVLVEQLLDLSRLDAEAVAITPQRISVRERVDGLVAAAAGAGDTEVEVTIEPELETVADPIAFDRIVSNLVANALRYGEPPVVVAAQRGDHHFRLVVEDHGPGVPPEFVPDLFERFTRSRTARDRSSGTGLGLAIARSYAHAHRGDLLYEPAEPTGSRFMLVLPSGHDA